MPRYGSSSTPRSDGDIFWDELVLILTGSSPRTSGGTTAKNFLAARAASETPKPSRRKHRRNTDNPPIGHIGTNALSINAHGAAHGWVARLCPLSSSSAPTRHVARQRADDRRRSIIHRRRERGMISKRSGSRRSVAAHEHSVDARLEKPRGFECYDTPRRDRGGIFGSLDRVSARSFFESTWKEPKE